MQQPPCNPAAEESSGAATALACGCCTKPSQKSRSALAEMHVRAAVRDDLGTDGPLATDGMAVFEAHP